MYSDLVFRLEMLVSETLTF